MILSEAKLTKEQLNDRCNEYVTAVREGNSVHCPVCHTLSFVLGIELSRPIYPFAILRVTFSLNRVTCEYTWWAEND